MTAQRLSNWRAGRHLPDRFDTIAPVLIWLTLRAREHHNGLSGDAPSVRSMRDWYRLFSEQQSPAAAAALDLNARIEATEFLLAHVDPEPAHDAPNTAGAQVGDSFAAARLTEELTTAILQLTGIDPTSGIPVATEARFGALPVGAADLLSGTGLITTAPSPTDTVRWVDPKTATLWDRAASVIEQYRPALAARTALLADAARWNNSGDPHGLYAWQQLTTCGRHLHTLPAAIVSAGTPPVPPARRAYRFGDGATAHHIPEPALRFWDASQDAAQRQLTLHRLIMATIIGLIALAMTTAAIAGILTS